MSAADVRGLNDGKTRCSSSKTRGPPFGAARRAAFFSYQLRSVVVGFNANTYFVGAS